MKSNFLKLILAALILAPVLASAQSKKKEPPRKVNQQHQSNNNNNTNKGSKARFVQETTGIKENFGGKDDSFSLLL